MDLKEPIGSIIVGQPPEYGLNGKTTYVLGYNEKFCYSCNVTAGGGPFTFNFPKIEVTALPKRNETEILLNNNRSAADALKEFLAKIKEE